MKLNQIIAIANGEKSKKQSMLTKIYQLLQKSELFEGHSKRYTPFEEDTTGGNKLPPEDKVLQLNVLDAISDTKVVLENMFNIVATQDKANCIAAADIKIEDTVIVSTVPVTHLLFLEKQLIDLKTFVGKFPILDKAEVWQFDETSNSYRSVAKETIRSKRIQKNHVKAEATKEHPAQVEVYGEDIPAGKWTTIRFSGCISSKDKKDILDRISELDKAVKMAREEANGIGITKSDVGSKILDYIFG